MSARLLSEKGYAPPAYPFRSRSWLNPQPSEKVPFTFGRNLFSGASYRLQSQQSEPSLEVKDHSPTMKCPHCSIMFHDVWNIIPIPVSGTGSGPSGLKATVCPNCKEPIVRLGVIQTLNKDGNFTFHMSDTESFLAYPKFPQRSPIGDVVPTSFKADYLEACNVLAISAKASAALSRRVLQGVLSENGYTGRDLAKQIESVLNESDPRRALPAGVRETVDAIRNFGNFAAHPVQDKSGLQGIIEVEEHEAEWCLEIIEALFDHYYVRPVESAKRTAALNKKLADAGKPPAKS